MQPACEINTHVCSLLWGILGSTLNLGERGRDIDNTGDIEMFVYFTDAGMGGVASRAEDEDRAVGVLERMRSRSGGR